MPYVASVELVAGVLDRDVRSIARLLSRAESGNDEAREALDTIFAKAGRAHVVGMTGVPGSGKSTLVAKLAKAVRASGRTIAIVAIDPSSPFSGGAILGDRIRMAELGGDRGVFVRSMATRGALGGLARGTLEAVDVLDAAGFDVVIIETVGVGQDEVEVARAAHTTVVVSPPGLGDDIQAIKAGILEIADIHVVSKCDRPDADRTIADLKIDAVARARIGPQERVADPGAAGRRAARRRDCRAARSDRSPSRNPRAQRRDREPAARHRGASRAARRRGLAAPAIGAYPRGRDRRAAR